MNTKNTQTSIKLYATPLSHFSRKARILLDLYNIPYQFIDIGNVAQIDKSLFAGNPILRVPVLVEDKNWIIESDHIAKYIVEKFDSSDRFRVNNVNFDELNTRAVLNGVMSEEVKLIIARRTGLPTEEYEFFKKCKIMIQTGLEWLEAHSSFFNTKQPGYLEFHACCLWQHLAYYELFPLNYPSLHKVVEHTLENPLVASSSPFILKPKSS